MSASNTRDRDERADSTAWSKLTDTRRARVLSALSRGVPYAIAARAGGIDPRTLRRWRERGRRAKRAADAGEPVAKGEQLFVAFAAEVAEAEVSAEVELVSLWYEGAKSDWRAARDLLARRWPKRWSAKQEAVLVEEGRDLLSVLTPAVKIYLPAKDGAGG